MLTSPFSTFAQLVKINGQCISKNNKPLPGVLVDVSVYRRNTFITDSAGTFSFFANQGDTLKIRYRYDGQTIRRESIVNENEVKFLEIIKFDVASIGQINLSEDKKDPFEIEYLKP